VISKYNVSTLPLEVFVRVTRALNFTKGLKEVGSVRKMVKRARFAMSLSVLVKVLMKS